MLMHVFDELQQHNKWMSICKTNFVKFCGIPNITQNILS